MTAQIKLSELPKHSLRFATEKRVVHIDDAPEAVEQTYLTIDGSPDGFRWLARHLASMAKSAAVGGSAGNIVAPWDFSNQPLNLSEWDSIDFSCRKEFGK